MLLVRTVVAARRGDSEEAARLLDAVLASLERVPESSMHADVRLELAEAAALLGREDEARALVDAAAVTAAEKGYVVALERARSRAGGYSKTAS
jgi:thioredoxin-like negative regulator of GroEL